MLVKDDITPGAASEGCAREPLSKRLTTLRVGTITVGGERELCLVRNVSEGGMRAYVYSPLQVGDHVTVELKTDRQIRGSVSWTREHDVGVQFEERIDVEELLAASVPGESARSGRMPRVDVDRLGELRIGSRLYPINTCDMSQGGVRIEIDHPLEVGEAVVLSLTKLRPIGGSVRWYKGGMGGIAFNQVIPFHELMRWLRD
jgi:hypothetical protein